MPSSYAQELRRMLAEMEDTRRHLDADIADIRRILARHEQGQPTPRVIEDVGTTISDHVGHTPKGAARAAILTVMQDGRRWRAPDVAKQLGKSKGSVSTAMIRMVGAGLLENPEYGLYVIAGQRTPTAPVGAPDTPGATNLTLNEGGTDVESS